MKKFKRILKTTVSVILITVLSVVSVSAASSDELSKEVAEFKQLQMYLNNNVRYDDVTSQSLAEGALFRILEENPELLELALTGMLESIDAYSEYYTEEEFQSFFSTVIDPSFGGIGVVAQKTDVGIKITSIIEGGGAEKAGILTGDYLISVDDMKADDYGFDALMDAVRGEIGSTVKIGIKRGEKEIYFDIVRAKVEQQMVYSNVIEKDGKKIMYIELAQFTQNTAQEVEKVVKSAKEQNIDNIILDLRDNPGGVLEDVVNMAGLFVPKGSVVLKTDYKINFYNTEEKTDREPYKVNLAVLVNENSASGAEAFAAAISQNKAGTVFGTTTFGKGTVQTTRGFVDGGGMKYTEAYYLTPLGDNINKIGFTPDIVVENKYTPVDFSEFGELKGGKIYTVGDKDEDIKFIKNVFARMGIYSGEINDVFDAELETLITSFQSVYDLYPYGVIDFTTQYKIREYMNECKDVEDLQLQAAMDMF